MNFREEIETELRQCLQEVPGSEGGGTPHPLKIMNLYHLGFADEEGNLKFESKGKYLRPRLCMAFCGGLGGDPAVAAPAAAAIEMAHRTSLIFDDIQDNGMERNGQPTVVAQWGINQAINAGLVMSCYSRLMTHRLKLPPEWVFQINSIMESTVIAMAQGQYWDIYFGDNPGGVSLDAYIDMIKGKTANLFGSACLIGAICAGRHGNSRCLDAKSFGINLGMAFQIQDDYLGIWGDSVFRGKTPNDLEEGKSSLPVVLAYQENPTVTMRWLGSGKNKDPFIEWMETQGIRDAVLRYGSEYWNKARNNLDRLDLIQEYDSMIRQAMELSKI